MSLNNNSDKACLLIHGFGGATFEMEHIAESLKNRGIRVELPLLPGHGTNIEDFMQTSFDDWFAKAEEEFLILRNQVEHLGLVGFSMGGVLALLLAAKYKPDALVCISTPASTMLEMAFQRRDLRILALPILKYLKPIIYSSGPKPESIAIAPVQGYEGVLCVPPTLSLAKGFRRVKKALCEVSCPILIFNDLHDRQVAACNALRIARKVSSKHIDLNFTHIKEKITSKHMLVTHEETKDFLAKKVSGFMEKLGDESSFG